MKKLFIALTLALLTAGTACVAACSKTTSPADKFDALDSTQSVYGFSAASAGMIISSLNDGTTSAPADATEQQPAAPAEDGTGQQTTPPAEDGAGQQTTPPADGGTDESLPADLDGYMQLVGTLLGDEAFSVTESASDREEYKFKTTVKFTDIDGNASQYEMYYDKYDVRTEYDRDRDDEFEEEYRLEGIVIIDGAEYAVRGENETEREDNEYGNELELRVTISADSYLLVEYSDETEGRKQEREYSYSLYRGGKLVERSTFEYEDEGRETELVMTYTKDGQARVLCFEKERRQQRDVIRLRIDRDSYIVTEHTDEQGNRHYNYEKLNDYGG